MSAEAQPTVSTTAAPTSAQQAEGRRFSPAAPPAPLEPAQPAVQKPALPLFRADALSARADQWLGKTQAVQPWPMRVVAPVGAALALALIAFLVFGQYTQRARVQGVLAPSGGLIKLAAPQQARILSLKVADGDRVAKGQPLYLLDLDRQTELGGASETVLSALKSQREELQNELLRRTVADKERQEALKVKLADLAREIAQVDRQIATGEDYVRVLEEELDSYKDYLKRGITIQRDVADRRARMMTEKTQLEQLRRDRVRLESDENASKAEITQIDRESGSKLSEIRRQIAEADRTIAETEAQRRIEIVAPETGRVTAVVAHAGQSVPNGAPLLTIVPDSGTLQANLYAESSAIGFAREGAQVMLRYAAFPYQKFGQHPGVVTAISRAALRQEEVDNGVPMPAELQGRGALYRLTVKPQAAEITAYGKRQQLQPGMQVEADIFLDSRPIWQWILNPLYSLKPLHGGPKDEGGAGQAREGG
ncbi:HlyD family efflux transporter periplasmic adaptor subunit [Chelatococcus sambhunathii]|uniref:HlyD family efflux transporter periplasmic adaptor subunit n=1 Tax=Chelatococcus sambhunathii TaxID=363953 RepID=A0ABU1DFZ5_9HYPH|nr:HlyD family efflux transporter periplasmic adaptor subunit [Chelatococcus sambhunathii]MDR4306830.1 HlyD family efflux transporter periplasmic adaptor subunit [Chelatococcus sambhunathii]